MEYDSPQEEKELLEQAEKTQWDERLKYKAVKPLSV